MEAIPYFQTNLAPTKNPTKVSEKEGAESSAARISFSDLEANWAILTLKTNVLTRVESRKSGNQVTSGHHFPNFEKPGCLKAKWINGQTSREPHARKGNPSRESGVSDESWPCAVAIWRAQKKKKNGRTVDFSDDFLEDFYTDFFSDLLRIRSRWSSHWEWIPSPKSITFCPLDMETKMKENMDFLVISAPCHKIMRIPFRGCFFLDIFFPFPSLCPPESSAPRWFVAFGTDESEKCGSPNYSHLIWNMRMN